MAPMLVSHAIDIPEKHPFSIKIFCFSINFHIFATMEIKKPESFWDVLIWVAVLLAVFLSVGMLLNHLFPEWGRPIWLLFLFLLMVLREVPFLKRQAEEFFPEILSWVVTLAGGAESILGLMDKGGKHSSLIVWFFPVFIILLTNRLYRESKKKEEEARKEQELLREPRALLNNSLSSDKKALILLFNARMEEVSFEVDDRMFLYSLPDGRFLVLFRKPVSLEDFLHALSAFRSEVDDDEDAVGFYGQTFFGVRPDSLQAYVTDLSGVCRAVPFEIDSASLTGAEPV